MQVSFYGMNTRMMETSANHPLVQTRKQQRLSREALAALAGLSPRTIYQLEHKIVQPNRATIKVLCLALNCEPSQIGLA